MKKLPLFLLILLFTFQAKAQPVNCRFKEPQITIHFGAGSVRDLNTEGLYNYRRVSSYCPTDGHYAYTSYTDDCFRGDWFTLSEDHTPGDVDGNMMVVNASPRSGAFLSTTINGLKGGTTYEFAAWMMNMCKITEKCPFPLLPSITMLLQTPDGKIVAQLGIGELGRRESPQWTQYRALFTTPSSETPLTLTMIDNAPGGCGNDFALDDITFSECVKPKPVVVTIAKAPVVAKKLPPTSKPVVKKETPAPATSKPVAKKETPAPATSKPVAKKETPAPATSKPVAKKETPALAPSKPVVKKETPALATSKPVVKKETPAPLTSKPVVKKVTPAPATLKPVVKEEPQAPGKRPMQASRIAKPQTDSAVFTPPAIKQKPLVFVAPPPVLTTRANALIKQIETGPGEIRLDLYDNGTIDGDTVSIYHNNKLLVAHALLSQKPISFRIAIDSAHPHHELIMVAENLGSIPPNTSLMIITAGDKRYEVFISSTEQKNAKVVLELKN